MLSFRAATRRTAALALTSLTSLHADIRKRFRSSVLIFGDSNTWGYNPKPRLVPRRIGDGDRWTDLLEKRLNSNVDENCEGFRIHVDALNARTTCFEDPLGPCDGEYNCSGRSAFMTALHAHKPLDAVVIALGTNDLKTQFGLLPEQIAAGVRILCRDVERATHIGKVAGDSKGVKLTGSRPEIVILGIPKIMETQISLSWGFEGATQKSTATVPLLKQVADASGAIFVDLQPVPVSPLDGVHFDATSQEEIASLVEVALSAALEKRKTK